MAIATVPLPDVVLLDIHLGNKSGLTLVHWARKQRHLAHMPIAAVTGLASFKELKSIGEAGCDTCFTKPIDFRTLRGYLAGLVVHSGWLTALRLRTLGIPRESVNFFLAQNATMAP